MNAGMKLALSEARRALGLGQSLRSDGFIRRLPKPAGVHRPVGEFPAAARIFKPTLFNVVSVGNDVRDDRIREQGCGGKSGPPRCIGRAAATRTAAGHISAEPSRRARDGAANAPMRRHRRQRGIAA